MSEREPPHVGEQVRTLRQQQGLSLRALADRCELSPNTISLIERGATSPSVSTLHRLAMALQVPITAFFRDHGDKVEVIVTLNGKRARFGRADAFLESLGSGLQAQTMEPFVVTLQPGAGSGSQEMSHAGHEMVYCLRGEIEYQVAGQSYRLAVGDALLFEARLAHCWRNPGNSPAVFVLVFEAASTREPMEQHLSS